MWSMTKVCQLNFFLKLYFLLLTQSCHYALVILISYNKNIKKLKSWKQTPTLHYKQ